jgi:hypothetical protein
MDWHYHHFQTCPNFPKQSIPHPPPFAQQIQSRWPRNWYLSWCCSIMQGGQCHSVPKIYKKRDPRLFLRHQKSHRLSKLTHFYWLRQWKFVDVSVAIRTSPSTTLISTSSKLFCSGAICWLIVVCKTTRNLFTFSLSMVAPSPSSASAVPPILLAPFAKFLSSLPPWPCPKSWWHPSLSFHPSYSPCHAPSLDGPGRAAILVATRPCLYGGSILLLCRTRRATIFVGHTPSLDGPGQAWHHTGCAPSIDGTSWAQYPTSRAPSLNWGWAWAAIILGSRKAILQGCAPSVYGPSWAWYCTGCAPSLNGGWAWAAFLPAAMKSSFKAASPVLMAPAELNVVLAEPQVSMAPAKLNTPFIQWQQNCSRSYKQIKWGALSAAGGSLQEPFAAPPKQIRSSPASNTDIIVSSTTCRIKTPSKSAQPLLWQRHAYLSWKWKGTVCLQGFTLDQCEEV